MTDGTIFLDYQAAKSNITEARTQLGELVNKTNTVVDNLVELQEMVHDVANTSMSEDYKDLEVIYSDSGIVNYINEIEKFLDNVETSVDEYYSLTH